MQPPGRESFQFGEVMQNFTQGKVAMYGTESWAIPLLLDSEASLVSQKIPASRLFLAGAIRKRVRFSRRCSRRVPPI